MLSSIGSLLEAAQRLERQNDSYFDALRVSTLGILQKLEGNHTTYMKNMENAQSQQNVMATQIEQLHTELNRLIAIGEPLKAKSRKCIHILDSLQYKRMTARYEKIVEAHAKTFEWIYDESTLSQHGEPQHHFLQWLESGDGLFWVSGKAGSGKSTLMRFITEHLKTRLALSRWASDQQLITAGFYFWHAGTVLQKSQEGLLQSLLYETFSQCPELIPDVLPERWKSCKPSNLTNRHWSRAELIKAFAKLSNQPTMLKRACFFIDGLDEYDGDHDELIRLLRSFSRPNNIKICASSRPWNVFKRAFGTRSDTMLRLEDLTRNDITLYVRETLELNDLFNQLKERENAPCVKLVDEVVSKAQGVFLWVFLVVRSLLTGLTNADRIMDLRKRLRHLPADLESYFAHMLASIDTFYEQQTAQTFKIALDASEPQTIMTYVMLDELDEDPQFALHLDIREWQSSEIRSRVENMVLRINARGMGLLEVVRGKNSDGLGADEVDFLHRTVRDFFRLEAPGDWIARHLPPSFNPDELLYNAILAQVKSLSVKSPGGPEKVLHLVDVMMHYAYNLEKDSETAPTILLDNLAHTISQLLKTSHMPPHWEQQPYYHRIRQLQTSFLSLAVQKDLKLYVAEELDRRSWSSPSEDVWLICRALRPDFSTSGNRAMLHLLLEKGVHMTKEDNSWPILFSEIADGWAHAPDKEKILQLETINILLAVRDNPREALGTTYWQCLLYALSENWFSGSIEMQRVLKPTMLSVLKTVANLGESVYWRNILWQILLLEVKDPIKGLDVGLVSKEIIMEIIRMFRLHAASLDPHHVRVISILCQGPYFSMEQKAELKAMIASGSINPPALPYRLHPVPGQTLDDPSQNLKRPAPDSDSETGSPDQKPLKRPFRSNTAPLICAPSSIVYSSHDDCETPITSSPSSPSDG